MNFQIALLLGILAVALALFSSERIATDVVALGVLLALVFTGLLPKDKAFDGFGSDTVIMILGLLILTAALERTGVVELTGRAVLRHTGKDPDRLYWIVIVVSAGLGSFISNTASTAFFLPIVFGLAKKTGTSASKLLMPLAFSGILTSSVTLVSTSSNMVVSGMIKKYGMPEMGMFELAPVGIPIAIVGLAYIYLARRFIPEREPTKELTEEFGLGDYLSEAVIVENSPLAGKTLTEARLGQELGLNVLRILRNKRTLPATARTKLQAGDMLMVEASQDDLLKIKDTAGIEIKADVHLSDPDLATEDMALVEAALLPGSPLIGRTLNQSRFRHRYGLQVLGINHHGKNVVRKLSRVPLQLGDVLLFQGRPEDIARLHGENIFQILGEVESMEEKLPKRRHAPLAIGIFVAVLVATTCGVSLPLAAMAGVLLVFVTGCITPGEAYRAVAWKAIILIGAMLGLGAAMDHTGTAKYLAGLIVSLTSQANPLWLLTGFFVLAVLLTQPMSNQAAAIVLLPVAIETAQQAGLNPRTFAMMIAVAASTSYLTPLEPACLMVYGPGRYRFIDFFKFGSVLTLLIYAISIALVPIVWPLKQ
jgi:di/tricarboxylate transporter